jgi:transcriptional regulator with XRE-family HTH domain
MTLSEYRAAKGLSLEAMGGLVGKSKAHIHAIENGERCSARLALAIERETRGLVDAASLNSEVAEARRAAA